MHEPAANKPQNDVIDVFALLKGLWRNKWVIVGVTCLVVSLAVIYTFRVQPLYEAKIYTLPPAKSDIDVLSFGIASDADSAIFKVKDVSKSFARNLSSESMRREFFNEVYLPSLSDDDRKESPDRLYQQFSSQLIVKAPVKDGDRHLVVTLQGASPKVIAKWLQVYVDKVEARTRADMFSDIKRDAQLRARMIDQKISLLREAARDQREYQLQILNEALVIAKTVGIKGPVIISGKSTTGAQTAIDGQALYMRGSDALTAEINILERRNSDDPFIIGLRSLQAESDLLAHFKPDQLKISIYRQDGGMVLSDRPIKPNKGLIIGLATVLGLMLGLLAAGGIYAIQRNRAN